MDAMRCEEEIELFHNYSLPRMSTFDEYELLLCDEAQAISLDEPIQDMNQQM